ncbi:hypothetical protein ACFFUB_01810 [Algimonas porphyrae]|uniref:Yip1 domain-containing protein n=1 Tax=Algimonas porphyrae TaxID=1128113 RepID=A0ABQ5UZQ9_9PROT|nr:hypothetical protein [Algimonas porphyrae]GLQ20775.1 hypothetical protein GCM10007854_17300 [Algimonas porphyrae]
MSGPNIDLEERNPLGGLDRLVTGAGLAIIAVFPTLFVAIFQPWKLAPLLIADDPDGRQGMILSPGAYFVLSLAVILVFVGSLVTPEIVQSNGGAIGPKLAVDVAAAAAEGDIWKTLSRIAPVFVAAVLFGILGRALTRFAGEWWDIRVSLRASFYAIATAICWIILSSLIIDAAGVAMEGWNKQTLYDLNTIPILSLPMWVYFWCFRMGGSMSTFRALGLTAAMAVLILGFFLVFSLVLNAI